MNENILTSLPLADKVWKLPSLALLYLISVTVVGPSLMKNKKPIKWVKKIIPLYNLAQVIVNGGIVMYAMSDVKFVNFVFTTCCGGVTKDPDMELKFVLLGYTWCMVKVSDFLDTIFFIMLKKQSHVTFLHVYHHTTTMLVAYAVFMFVRTEQSAMYAAVNSLIHVIMYSYYFMTSIGYKCAWKKLVTVAQLSQFVFLMLMTAFLLVTCQRTPVYVYFSVYSLAQCIMYIYLFGKFYKRSYSPMRPMVKYE